MRYEGDDGDGNGGYGGGGSGGSGGQGNSISAIFTPVGPHTSDNATGTVIYHITLVYKTPFGSEYISAGPQISNATLKLSTGDTLTGIVKAADNVLTNTPSVWGTLKVNGQSSFTPGDRVAGIDVVPNINPDTGIRNSDGGTKYSSETITNSANDSTWAQIKQAYNDMSGLNLTYSPATQNSNSVACTALNVAGLSIPQSLSLMKQAPACDIKLPTKPSELQNYLDKWKSHTDMPLNVRWDANAAGDLVQTIQSNRFDYLSWQSITTKTGNVKVQEVKNIDSDSITLMEGADITVSGADIYLGTDGLDVDVAGDGNIISNGDYQNLDVVGDNNYAYMDYSSIDFSGSDNYAYGDGNYGGGWDFGGGGEFRAFASADQGNNTGLSPSGRIDSSKLVESMSAFARSSFVSAPPRNGADIGWATIATRS